MTTATVPPLVFRDEPALKTVPAEPGELPYEVADQDVSYQCGMRHDGQPTHGYVGWVEREHADTYGRDLIDLEWVSFYEIQLPGDAEPTRFCEDCAGWLTALAPHLLTGDTEQIEARDLAASDVLIVEGEMLTVSSVKLDEHRVEFELAGRFSTFAYLANDPVFIKRRG